MANTILNSLQCKCMDQIRPFAACQIIIMLGHIYLHPTAPLPVIRCCQRREVEITYTHSYLVLLATKDSEFTVIHVSLVAFK